LLDSRLLRPLFFALRLGLLRVPRLPLRTPFTRPTLGLLLVRPTAAFRTLVATLFRTLIAARFRATFAVLALGTTLAVALRTFLVAAPLIAASVAHALSPVA
jgi:hypothetical protein